MLYATLAVLLLLMASAFTSGTETAMTAASRARIHQMAGDGNRRARLAKGLLASKERLIGSLLLGNNLFNVLATALAADVLIKLFGDAGIAYATLIMTALVVIFAEVLPKTYAIRNPERMALGVAPLALMATAALAASMAFMLPVATPPNAIVFGSGYMTIPQMVRAGIWMNIVAVGFIIAAGTWLVPVLL